jgi:hypothetical protein
MRESTRASSQISQIRVNESATRAVRFARFDVVDRYRRRQLTALPFRARQSSRNRPVRLGQHFSEDRLRALLVEGGDAMHRNVFRSVILIECFEQRFATDLETMCAPARC